MVVTLQDMTSCWLAHVSPLVALVGAAISHAAGIKLGLFVAWLWAPEPLDTGVKSTQSGMTPNPCDTLPPALARATVRLWISIPALLLLLVKLPWPKNTELLSAALFSKGGANARGNPFFVFFP